MFRLETPGGGGFGSPDECLFEVNKQEINTIMIVKAGSLNQYSANQESV